MVITNQRVLIIEDEEVLRDHLVSLLDVEGFTSSICSSVPEIDRLLEEQPVKNFDFILLDRLLNGRDAGPKIPEIKKNFVGSRLMVVSAINTPSEKASLLDLGADDYLAKPFDGEELVARVRALLRRNLTMTHFANLHLNLEDRKLFVDESEIHLTNKEFLFLKTLLQEPGKIFSKNYLYEKVWEMSPDVESNALETTITKLRRRLEEAGASAEIRNSRNVGYWIEE